MKEDEMAKEKCVQNVGGET